MLLNLFLIVLTAVAQRLAGLLLRPDNRLMGRHTLVLLALLGPTAFQRTVRTAGILQAHLIRLQTAGLGLLGLALLCNGRRSQL